MLLSCSLAISPTFHLFSTVVLHHGYRSGKDGGLSVARQHVPLNAGPLVGKPSTSLLMGSDSKLCTSALLGSDRPVPCSRSPSVSLEGPSPNDTISARNMARICICAPFVTRRHRPCPSDSHNSYYDLFGVVSGRPKSGAAGAPSASFWVEVKGWTLVERRSLIFFHLLLPGRLLPGHHGRNQLSKT